MDRETYFTVREKINKNWMKEKIIMKMSFIKSNKVILFYYYLSIINLLKVYSQQLIHLYKTVKIVSLNQKLFVMFISYYKKHGNHISSNLSLILDFLLNCFL